MEKGGTVFNLPRSKLAVLKDMHYNMSNIHKNLQTIVMY